MHAMLVTRICGVACALPIGQVVEIMRPLPIEPIGRPADPALALVEGIAMIRGVPIPVIDARRLLGAPTVPAGRFVIVRAKDQQIALMVDDVVEVTRIDPSELASLPPLVGGVHRDCITAIGARDAALLVVLDTVRVLPEDGWRALAHDDDAGLAR
jgi:purine-binding chemotaxis protein CheW